MTQLMCLICHEIRKTKDGMYHHLKRFHSETMRGHLNIIDGFSCEEGSVRWNIEIAKPVRQSILSQTAQVANPLTVNDKKFNVVEKEDLGDGSWRIYLEPLNVSDKTREDKP